MDKKMEDDFSCSENGMSHKIIESLMWANKCHRMILEHYLNRGGLFRGQHQILMCASRNPDASQKELAEIHNVSTAAVAVSLKKLEKGGYIERAVDKKDNRFNKIRLTEKGKCEVDNSILLFKRVERGMMAGLSEEEKRVLYSCIQKISANLEQMLQDTKKED